MRRGFFGARSRKTSEKMPGTPLNATVYAFISLVLVSIVFLMFSSSNVVSNAQDAGLSIFLGVRGGIYEMTSFVARTVLSVKELADLRKEHAELLKQLERYEELQRSNTEIDQENTRLREQLGFARTLRYKRIPAIISGRDPDNLFSAVVINKGSFAGISNNMAVVAWQNGTQALVGKVIQTGAFESLVMPFFDINSQVSARFSVSRFEGIVEGQGNSETPLLMRFVPKRARNELNIGDIIITSGMGGIFPQGINIGRVSAVNILEYEPTLEIEIIPMIDFSRLEYVFVIEVDDFSTDNDSAISEGEGLAND
ncbi:MAG: rod shape-determining protein MreC [Treponema sp.]|jgi:rod shape-determining protein MreC|nr:rod shape-determining protein MreC [Treponema sp.]